MANIKFTGVYGFIYCFPFQGLKKAGLMKLFYWWDPSKQTQSQSMPGMLRRGSLNASTSNLLGTSHESDHGSPGNR